VGELELSGEEFALSYYYEFEDRHRILLAVAYGRLDEDELGELYFDIRRRKDQEHALTGVLDLTGVTSFEVDAPFIRELAAHPANFPDPTLRAVVAPTDILFGMARMFQFLGSETREELHIVRTLHEVLTMLDVKESQFRKLETA
jgi:hypothetical protein